MNPDDAYEDLEDNTIQNARRNHEVRADLPPPAADETWERFRCRGAHIYRLMVSDDETAGSLLDPPQDTAASSFNNFPGELEKWYYYAFNDQQTDLGEWYYGLDVVLPHLGASSEKSDWKFWRVTHGDRRSGAPDLNSQTYVVDGHTYRATGAELTIPMNAQDGIILIAKQYSPATNGAKRNPPVEELPDLQRFSDICFGLWKMYADAAPVRHIISWAVTNYETRATMARALSTVGKNYLDDFPGLSFETDTEPGEALLGTPNGLGIGYFLAQHKADLGNLKIARVYVYFTDSAAFMERQMASMYWVVQPVDVDDSEGSEVVDE